MSSPTKPYENQLIAAFVFALGYAAREKTGARPFSVNLFQQTPLDQNFGDLIAGYRLCVALEFKRSADDVASERFKWSAQAINTFVRDKKLSHQADAAHRLVFGDTTRGSGILFCAYRPLLLEETPKLPAHDASRLISALCDGDEIGLPPAEADEYLRAIARLRDGGGDGDDPVPGGGAGFEARLRRSVWLAIAHDGEGAMAMIAATSLSELLGLNGDPHHDPGAKRTLRYRTA